MPLTAQGVKSGIVYPTRLPNLTDIAHIQEGLRVFYYGHEDGDVQTDPAELPAESIAYHIYRLNTDKLNILNGIAKTSLTIDNDSASSPTLKFVSDNGTLNIQATGLGTTATLNLPAVNGTVATTDSTAFEKLSNVGTDGSVSSIVIGGGGVSSLTIGNATTPPTVSVNIGTGAKSSGTKYINIGTGSTGGNTAIALGSPTGSSISLNGASSVVGTLGVSGLTSLTTLNVSGATSFSSKPTAPATIIGDGSTVLTTKGYVDDMVVTVSAKPGSASGYTEGTLILVAP